jgi:hypothetical protein
MYAGTWSMNYNVRNLGTKGMWVVSYIPRPIIIHKRLNKKQCIELDHIFIKNRSTPIRLEAVYNPEPL